MNERLWPIQNPLSILFHLHSYGFLSAAKVLNLFSGARSSRSRSLHYSHIHLAQLPSLDIEHETADLPFQFWPHEMALLQDGDVVFDALFEAVVHRSSQLLLSSRNGPVLFSVQYLPN